MYRARTRRSTALVNFCRNDRRLPPMSRGTMDDVAVVAGDRRQAESSEDSVDGRSAGGDSSGVDGSRPPRDSRGRLVVRLPNARDPSPADGRQGDSEAEQPENAVVPAPATVKVSYGALSKPKNGGRVRSYPEVKRRAGQLLQPLAVCEVYHISRSVVSEIGQELENAAARYRGGGGGQPEESPSGGSTASRGPPRVASDVKCVRITFDNSVLRHAGGARRPGGSGGSGSVGSDPATGSDRRPSHALTSNAEAVNFADWSASSATRSWPSATAGRERRRPTAAAAAAHERRDAASSARSGATQLAVSSSPRRDSDFSEFEDDARSRFRTHAAAAAAAALTYDDESAAAAAPWPLDAPLRERTSVLLPRLVNDGNGDELRKQRDGASAAAGFALPELQAAAGDLMTRPPTRRTRQTLLQKKFDETLRIFRKTRERIFELNSERSRLVDSARAEPAQQGQQVTLPSTTTEPKSYAESMNDAYARAATIANGSRRLAGHASLTGAYSNAAGGLLPPIPVDNETGTTASDNQQTLTFEGLSSDDMARPSRKVMFEEDVYAHFRHTKYRKRQDPTRKRGKRYEELDAMQFLNVKVGQS